jgi:serine/threonine protein kinase
MLGLGYSHQATELESSSNSRSSRAPFNDQAALHISDGLEAYGTQSSTSGNATVVEVFVAALHQSNLPGPVILIDETAERVMIGRGSQFVVYRQRMAVPELTQFSTRTVAVKVPRFSLNPKAPLRLAGAAAQKHIHDMYLEVLALTNPTIRSHPYVARLLAWSYDAYTMNTPLYLVMELAECSLRSFLQNPAEAVAHSLRYGLCRNVAAGVDVLHECGLIHGDLKADNILIFRNRKGAYVAKVADFGLSVAEAVSGIGPVSNVYIGGTLGWQAPEVEMARFIPRDLLASTDNYSFGLLTWSVVLLDGSVPPRSEQGCRSNLAREQMQMMRRELPFDVCHDLVEAVSALLQSDPAQRPILLEPLFSNSTGYHSDMYVKNFIYRPS